MSDRVESSDDDVEDPTLNYEVSWRQLGVEGGGNDSDGDIVEEEEEEEEQKGGHKQLGRPYIREPNYPSYRGPIDYYQAGMADTVVNLRRTNPANEARTATDYKFRTFFQHDYYTTTVITGRKANITNGAQYVDWEFMERKNNLIFDEVIQACEGKGIKVLMGFKQHWNKEVITRFYATDGYALNENGQSERTMFWMTEGENHQLSFSSFLTSFRLPNDGFAWKLHDEGPLEAKRMALMYPKNARDSWGHVKGLYTNYSILNRLFRKTLTPRDGNTSNITAFQRNLMVAMKPSETMFNVGYFLWQEIKNSSENPQRLCSYGPYISYIIKKVTQRVYPCRCGIWSRH
jgi:hypothetical protein